MAGAKRSICFVKDHGLKALQLERLPELDFDALLATIVAKESTHSEVSKRGWREGVGDKQTPKNPEGLRHTN